MRWPLTLLGALALSSPLSEGRADDVSRALPAPLREGGADLNAALQTRRSVREFAAQPLSMPQLAQLLWSAQGITSPDGGRTVPSAGATYPLTVYVAVGEVDGLQPGTYRYRPAEHDLVLQQAGDVRAHLAEAAVQQDWIAGAPALLILAATYVRTTGKYGERGTRYVEMEAGAAAQSVHLMAASLGLGTTVVGAFDDRRVTGTLKLPRGTTPLLILPVGVPAGTGAGEETPRF